MYIFIILIIYLLCQWGHSPVSLQFDDSIQFDVSIQFDDSNQFDDSIKLTWKKPCAAGLRKR